MPEKNDAPDGHRDICPEMDELLCEYVDGTMDPAVCAVFEECISADPVLEKRVQELRCTRSLLNRYGHKLRRDNEEAVLGFQDIGKQDCSNAGQSMTAMLCQCRVDVRTLLAATVTSLVVGVLTGMMLVRQGAQETTQVASQPATELEIIGRDDVMRSRGPLQVQQRSYLDILNNRLEPASLEGK